MDSTSLPLFLEMNSILAEAIDPRRVSSDEPRREARARCLVVSRAFATCSDGRDHRRSGLLQLRCSPCSDATRVVARWGGVSILCSVRVRGEPPGKATGSKCTACIALPVRSKAADSQRC
jgi:hypothetical protein